MYQLVLHFVIGMLIVGVGVFFVFKTSDILDFFGPVEWAERRLGSSSLFYKLLGVFFAFIGLVVAFNLWNAFLAATIGQIFPGSRNN
jgi:hypothetical protein